MEMSLERIGFSDTGPGVGADFSDWLLHLVKRSPPPSPSHAHRVEENH